MNSREVVRNNKTDLVIGRALKSWVENSGPPEPRREELIQAAKFYPRIPRRWIMARFLIRILIMSFKGRPAGEVRWDELPVYTYTAGGSLRIPSSASQVSMLQLSILYLTSPRLYVSSFIL